MPDLIPAPRPVESPEDRMRHATAPSFRTYLDRTEREQLDAEAASAAQERDDALDDLRAVRYERDTLRRDLTAASRERDEAVSLLARIGDAISPTGERPEEALGTLVRDVEAVVAQRDEALEARDVLRARLDLAHQLSAERGSAIDLLRAELGAAQEVIAVIRDAGERIDRALAAYETRQQQEQAADLGSPADRAQDEPRNPGDALTDALRNAYTTEQLAGLHERLVHDLDGDEDQDDPMGRLVDALFVARWRPVVTVELPGVSR